MSRLHPSCYHQGACATYSVFLTQAHWEQRWGEALLPPPLPWLAEQLRACPHPPKQSFQTLLLAFVVLADNKA